MLQLNFSSKRNRSINMSVPKSYVLNGITIRKLPVAKYIAVLREVNDLPSLLLGELMPDGGSLADIAEGLSALDKAALIELLGRLLKVVPAELCRVLSELLDIPEERLLDPDCENPLSLNELAEVIKAFWKINDMSDFLKTVQSLKAQTTPARSKQNGGYSDGSQSLSQSVLQGQS